jgi:hypothetical protein
MTAGLLGQYGVIALIVLVSVLGVFRKLAPQLTNRWLAAASIRLSAPRHARWVRALGLRLQPRQATGQCSDGCSTCGACGSKPPATAQPGAVPLNFRPRNHAG